MCANSVTSDSDAADAGFAGVGPQAPVLENKVDRSRHGSAQRSRTSVDEWAVKLASKSPVLMKLGKDAMYRQLDMPLDEALDFLRSQLSIAFTTEDIQEGVKAFFEKRDPNWTGR